MYILHRLSLRNRTLNVLTYPFAFYKRKTMSVYSECLSYSYVNINLLNSFGLYNILVQNSDVVLNAFKIKLTVFLTKRQVNKCTDYLYLKPQCLS